jgi:hypothetical protein
MARAYPIWSVQHGCCRKHFKTPEYLTWSRMRERCTSVRHKSYPRYGGRGIKVCEQWNSFANFLADMGLRPSAKHSLDRIDNDGNYSPENCRWATVKEQSRNRRNNHHITFNSKTATLQEWADSLNMSCHALSRRLTKGWPISRALTEPLSPRRPRRH